jgi:hypothetical protein
MTATQSGRTPYLMPFCMTPLHNKAPTSSSKATQEAGSHCHRSILQKDLQTYNRLIIVGYLVPQDYDDGPIRAETCRHFIIILIVEF